MLGRLYRLQQWHGPFFRTLINGGLILETAKKSTIGGHWQTWQCILDCLTAPGIYSKILTFRDLRTTLK